MGCPVIQWQMVVKDPEAESGFYTSLFGWQVSSDNPLGYRTVDTGSAEGIPAASGRRRPKGTISCSCSSAWTRCPGT